MAGDNRPVRLQEVIATSWALVKGSKTIILQGTFFLVLANMLAILLANLISPPAAPDAVPSLLDSVLVSVLTAAVSSPLLGGFALLAVARARGETLDGSMIFSGTRFATRFLTYGLITTGLSLLVYPLPFVLGQVLWLVVAVLLTFSSYFIVDRGLGAGQSMLASLSLVLANPVPVLGWLAVGVALTIVSALTLGIGLIWVLPFLVISNAMLYVESVPEAQPRPESD